MGEFIEFPRPVGRRRVQIDRRVENLLPNPLEGLVILASFHVGLHLLNGGFGVHFSVDLAGLDIGGSL